jgi:DMSO/TMAO reductase YedYZ heme-binding membrane subunit
MKTYLKTIKFLQQFFLGISILIMLVLPLILVFSPDTITPDISLRLYDAAHISIFFVMMVRPLADIFMGVPWIRPLVILRKGIGVFSASIAISFVFAKIIMDPSGYFSLLLTAEYWSLTDYALLGHLADLSAVILLTTSNNLSKRFLGTAWKKIQKLSYVFFYASSLYVFLSYGHMELLFSMALVSLVTIIAFLRNRRRTAAAVLQTT